MAYDKAIVTVFAEKPAVGEIKELVSELNSLSGFSVGIVSEEPGGRGVGADGSVEFTIEVNEYIGEYPLFTSKVEETVSGASVTDVDRRRGESELAE